MKVTLAQLNPRIGDLEANSKAILDALQECRDQDLMVTGELAVCGYPPLDLCDWPTFIQNVERCNQYLISQTQKTACLFGSLYMEGDKLRNTAILAENGREIARVNKRLLPNYNVFDERRYFTAVDSSSPIAFKGEKLGVTICEDAWTEKSVWPDCPYTLNIMEDLKKQGATQLINLSASPYHRKKPHLRRELFTIHAKTQGLPLYHVNQVGANDEIIFDGGSFALDSQGQLISQAPLFETHLLSDCPQHDWPDDLEEVYQALCLGVHDYFYKSGFSKAVIGLSGGIDSALVLCLAQKALGANNVSAVAMPGPYSSDHSINDARELAKALNVNYQIFPIQELFESMESSFQKSFGQPLDGIARQNAQARLRGQTLMNYSNATGALVITTGNKSELAVGYCTLYGDMCGALAAIGDCPKELVYNLCRHIKDTNCPKFPQNIIDKAPSAELAPDQKDEDTLPPYDALDRLVCDYVEGEKPLSELNQYLSDDEVKRWLRVIDLNEHKRRQAAPVLRVSTRAFGMGRRRPLAQGFNPSWIPETSE